MQFKHPEILYFLFLLIIPILVHLFQLRRFKKEYFTNVRFLKELSVQTRKSSKLKKWLLLTTRLLLLAAAVIAFAQPFFPAHDNSAASNEMFIVLDNSFSMEARGKKGELLKRAVEDLLENVPENRQFSLLTNDENFWDTDIRSIRRDLQNLRYSGVRFSPENALAKINSKNPNGGKDVIFITDGVGITETQFKSIRENSNVRFVIPKAETRENISIDSVYISQVMDNFYEIGIKLSANGGDFSDVQLGLYNNEKLVAKSMINLKDETSATFTIPKEDFHGYVSISDNGLKYDNTLFFSISKPELTNILSIGETSKAEFLTRIYTPSEFRFINFDVSALDYNIIEKQDVVILNEPNRVPQALQTTLKAFVANGGNLIVIPNESTPVEELNGMLSNYAIALQKSQPVEKQVTKIAFSHPLFAGVFEKKVQNFQYPKSRTGFSLRGNVPAALSFDNDEPFLASVKREASMVYVFTSPLNREASNFQNSPLIVPAFYNMAQSAGRTSVATITIGNGQSVILDAALSKDEILKVSGSNESFIPIQQLLSNKVKLSFGDYPTEAGNYGIFNKDQLLKRISFNHDRLESQNLEANPDAAGAFPTDESISSLFDDLQTNRTDNPLWKWFVALGLLFLVLEILIQKHVK